MQCATCGKETSSGKFCAECSKLYGVKESTPGSTETIAKPAGTNRTFKIVANIVSVIIGVVVIGFWAYGSLDDQAIDSNNDALDAYDSGDSDAAIAGLELAIDEAATTDTKIRALVNLAYVHLANDEATEAMARFEEASALAEPNSFRYHLISGEIAELNDDPASTLEHYLAAYEIDPYNSQINSTLALFYLDFSGVRADYADYAQAQFHAQAAYDAEQSPTTEENLGFAYYYNGDYENALKYFLMEDDFAVDPYMAMWTGYAYWDMGDTVNAQTYFLMAIEYGAEVPDEVYEFLGQ